MISDFRIDVLRDRVKIGEVLTDKARVDYDSSSAVMRSMSVEMYGTTVAESGFTFNKFKDRLRPVLISDGVESSLGVFMIVSAPRRVSETENTMSIEAYDESMIVKQAAFENRTHYAAGTQYLTIIQNILVGLGFSDILMDSSSAALAADIEYAPGDNYLEAINDMLDAMNYRHLYQDSNGIIQIRKIADPDSPQFVYRDKVNFSIIENIREESDIYDLPNVVIGVYSSPDSNTPTVYKKVNSDPNSAISTVNRGYKVVKMVNLYNSASQTDLKNYVDRIAFDAMQATESVTFETIAEGGHEMDSVIQIDVDGLAGLYVEKGWTIDASSGSYVMTHRAERKVFV